MCVRACVQVYLAKCVHACRGQRLILDIFLYCFSLYFLRQALSLNLQLAILATLAVPRASTICLSVHLMLGVTGVCCHMLLYLAFLSSRDQNSDSHV